MPAVHDGQFFLEHILFLNMYKFVLYFRHSIEFLNVTQLFDMRVVQSSRVGDAISSTFLNHVHFNLLRYFMLCNYHGITDYFVMLLLGR